MRVWIVLFSNLLITRHDRCQDKEHPSLVMLTLVRKPILLQLREVLGPQFPTPAM